MNKILTVLVILILIIIFKELRNGEAFPRTNEEVVEQFFPQRLIDESQKDFGEGGPFPFKTSNFVMANLNGDSTVFIVAAYSNGFSGIIRVLQQENGMFSLVDEPNIPTMGGDFPKIRLLDIDNDGISEIIVSFTSGRGPTEVWVFKWNGVKLNLISPTKVDPLGITDTILSDSLFIDLDGDKIIEIINPTGPGPVAPEVLKEIGVSGVNIYALENGNYTPLTSFNAFVNAIIDIKLGSFPNSINPRNKGVISVAILTTLTFNATTVDPLSVKFGPNGATESHGKGHIEDANGDGKPDLVLHFNTQNTGIKCGDTSAPLTGKTFSGDTLIVGSDSIQTVGCP